MRPIKVFFDKVGNTLNVWFDDPQKEHMSEATSEEVVLVKDIGIRSGVYAVLVLYLILRFRVI